MRQAKILSHTRWECKYHEPTGSVNQTALSGSRIKPPALPGGSYVCLA